MAEIAKNRTWTSPASMTSSQPLGLYFRSDDDIVSTSKMVTNRIVRAILDGAHWEDEAHEIDMSRGTFDRWLNEKLRIIYGPVLQEPIPEHLAELIAAHRQRRGES